MNNGWFLLTLSLSTPLLTHGWSAPPLPIAASQEPAALFGPPLPSSTGDRLVFVDTGDNNPAPTSQSLGKSASDDQAGGIDSPNGGSTGIRPPKDLSLRTPAPGSDLLDVTRESFPSLRDLPRSPWFALTSGLASIFGLLIALYTTQVRTIPFSLYRSLMWRKALLLTVGGGLFVFSGIKFYTQEERPYLEPLGAIHDLLVGANPYLSHGHGTSIWALLTIVAIVVIAFGVTYDAASKARQTIVREQQALQAAQELQIASLLGRKSFDQLSAADQRACTDIYDYYRHVQWRFADVVLGAPPPTFPLFRNDTSTMRPEGA